MPSLSGLATNKVNHTVVCFNSQELLSVHEQDLNRTSLKREGTNTLPSRQHEVSIEHSESHTTCYRAIYRNERCSAKQEPRSGNLWLNKAMANHGCMSSHLDAFRSIKNIYIYHILRASLILSVRLNAWESTLAVVFLLGEK